ncbi:multicopper oxidase domain-containing protein [Chloroflexales bacterium ZM16-3]|nr:multicopper oxidase domain-containing protein [Chloroflexales bacterium ZM16-3]
MRLIARYLTAAMLAVAMLALSLGSGVRQAEAAPAARLTGMTLSPTTVTLTSGASGSTLVTVTKNNRNNGSSATLSVSWAGGTPAGVGTSFSTSPLTWGNGSGDRTSTLTINTSTTTPAGSYTFTVQARRSNTDSVTATGTLVVESPVIVQQPGAVSFGAAPAATYLGGNFTVSTTSNSNGALTYSAVSGPCALVSGATFSTSGAGDCTVQADTAATTAYTAATAQQVVSIAQASQTISFATLANKPLGSAPFAVSATATSGLAVTFTADPPTVCTISGDTLALVDVGTCSLTADQAGDANYSAATTATAAFDVVAALTVGCPLNGNTRTCNLWAKSGTISLPGTSHPIRVWSYTDDANAAPGAIGPTLEANVGEDLAINLSNTLGVTTSLQIVGLAGKTDMMGVPSGGQQTYTFSNLPAGTYLYQAGITTDSGPRQIAMGMVGALVVHEAGNTAYGHSYTDEAVLVYSEIDPAFNGQNDGDSASFVLQHFNPAYLLINGKVYPSTDGISVQPQNSNGSTLLLRQVNAGIRFHTLGVLGLRQTVIADDAGPLPISSSLFAKTLGAGQTMDSLVTVPGNVPSGTTYALYETGMPGYGPAAGNGMGGLLTFITTGVASGDVVGPAMTVSLTPPTTDGTTDIVLDVTADDTNTGGSAITALSYSIDGGAAVDLLPAGTNVSEHPVVTLLGGDLAALGVGTHTVTATATDAATNTTTVSATFTVTSSAPLTDETAPAVSNAAVSPALSNGSGLLALSAMATDNVGVTGWSYTIGSTTTAFMVPSGTSVALNADIDVSGLADGIYTVDVQASDAAGNFSGTSTTFTIDSTAPTVTGSTTPAAVAPGAAVSLSVSFSDTRSAIVSASYTYTIIVNNVPTVVTAALNAQDGAFNSSSESAVAALSTTGLGEGTYTIAVSATDAAGNTSTTDIPFTIADSLFANGFETGATNSTWGWSSKSTTTSSRLQVNSTAAMAGTSRGLQAAFGTGNSANNYVQQNLVATESQLHVRFYLDPNSQNFGTGSKTIFKAMGDVNGVQTNAFRLDLRRTGTNTYQVRAAVARANGTSTTRWQSITNGSNYIELAWQQGASTQFTLYVNGTSVSLNNLLTSAYSVNTLRLGPQTSGTSNTNIYLDEFKTTRGTMIGAGAN